MSVLPRQWVDPLKERVLIKFADGSLSALRAADFRGTKVLIGQEPLLALKDIAWLETPSIKWMKEIDVPAAIAKAVEESDIQNKEELWRILNKADCARFKNDTGLLKAPPYVIRGAMPGKSRQYPLGKAEKEFKAIIKELLELDIVAETPEPPCLMPVQAVPKKDGTVRPVHNLKDLNDVTVKDTRQIINPRDVIMRLRPGKFNSSVDLSNGFWSIILDENSQYKTCFMLDGKGYRWKRLPQGLSNAPTAFQERMEEVLKGLPVIIYIDDVFFSSETEEEHLKLLEQVVDRLVQAGLKIGMNKCEIGKAQVKYLGIAVEAQSLQMIEGYLDGLKPTTVKGLESALGRTGWLRIYIPNYPVIVHPVEKLKRGLRKWDATRRKLIEEDRPLTAQELSDWESVMLQVRSSVRTLAPFRGDQALRIETYLSEEGGWASITEEGQEKPCMYLSHRFSHTEYRYSEVEKELVVLWKSYKEIRNLAGGKKVTVRTSSPLTKELHKNTVEFAKAFQQRWGKWAIMLQDPDWTFVMIGSKEPTQKQGAIKGWDGLYSIFTDGSKKETEEVGKWAFVVYRGDKRLTVQGQSGREGSTAQEAELLALLKALQWAKKKKIKNLRIIADSWYVVQGVRENLKYWQVREYQNYRGQDLGHKELWIVVAQLLKPMFVLIEHVNSHTAQQSFEHQGNREVDEVAQLRGVTRSHITFPSAWLGDRDVVSIPTDEAAEYLKRIHIQMGHPGVERMVQWYRSNRITTSDLAEKLKLARSTCEVCSKKGNLPPIGVKDLPIAEKDPGVSASADVGHLDKGKYRKFLVIADNGGGNTRVYPISSETAYEAEKAMMSYLEGNPTIRSLRTDNATMFTAGRFETWLQLHDIEHIHSIPYQSNTNGVAERAVRSVKEQIQVYGTQWWKPHNLFEINRYLSQPKLRKARVNEADPAPPVLQEGDQVWIKGTAETRTVQRQEGNVVILEDGTRKHPDQLRFKCRGDLPK